MQLASAFTHYLRQASSSNVAGWLWLGILIVGILIVWMLLIYQSSQSSLQNGVYQENASTSAVLEGEKPPQTAPRSSDAADDLTIIEGIGPKIAELLKNEGIDTFSKLAELDGKALEEILARANWRFAKPTTWSRQAKLVVEGDWEGLRELQDRLKGGTSAG